MRYKEWVPIDTLYKILKFYWLKPSDHFQNSRAGTILHGVESINFSKIFPEQSQLLSEYHHDINAQPNRCITKQQGLKIALIL